MIPAFWYVSGNFGDALTPWLIERISGRQALYVQAKHPGAHHIVAGSILAEAHAASIVWGAGIGSLSESVHPYASIRAVRGPLSRVRALQSGAQCPPVYGDPALLLPRLYQPRPLEKRPLGIVPHFVDQRRVAPELSGRDDVRLVNVLRPIETVIDEIAACERIVSSSLHGLIVAAAYGIPALWVRLGNELAGDGVKFFDFQMSMGLEPMLPLDLTTGPLPTTTELCRRVPPWGGGWNSEPLWEACPFCA